MYIPQEWSDKTRWFLGWASPCYVSYFEDNLHCTIPGSHIKSNPVCTCRGLSISCLEFALRNYPFFRMEGTCKWSMRNILKHHRWHKLSTCSFALKQFHRVVCFLCILTSLSVKLIIFSSTIFNLDFPQKFFSILIYLSSSEWWFQTAEWWTIWVILPVNSTITALKSLNCFGSPVF